MFNFQKIETERLVLRKLEISDADIITKYAGDRKISEFTLNIPFPYLEKDAVWWINNSFKGFEENTHYTFGIYLKDTKEFRISLLLDMKNSRASLGYWIAVPFWNKGFMTEAVNAIMKFGFETLNLNKIYAQHLVQNEASGKVMQKAGMILEGELKQHNIKDGIFRDLRQYRLLKSEFDLLKN